MLEGCGSSLAVAVMDSDSLFTPECYQYFGIQKHTTHEGEGGTGLMDIFLLETFRAKELRSTLQRPDLMISLGKK